MLIGGLSTIPHLPFCFCIAQFSGSLKPLLALPRIWSSRQRIPKLELSLCIASFRPGCQKLYFAFSRPVLKSNGNRKVHSTKETDHGSRAEPNSHGTCDRETDRKGNAEELAAGDRVSIWLLAGDT